MFFKSKDANYNDMSVTQTNKLFVHYDSLTIACVKGI